MATINVSKPQGGGHPSRHGATNVPYTVETILDFADVLVAKGSALEAADVVEALAVPTQSVVLTAGVEILAPANSTTLTLDVGVTGVDADVWVDGLDAKGAAGTYAQNPAAYQPIVVGNTADTIDVLFATLTGTLSTGKVRVFAVLLDVSDKKAPGVATSTASA
jgi:hypothetical protein